MKTASLRSKRVVLPAIAVAGVLAAGGTVWSATANDDLRGNERERVASAAVQAVGGTVMEVETSDDAGAAYEVEVRADDGSEIDVAVDQDLNVVSREVEAGDHDQARDDDETRDDDEGRDADDRALSGSERASAEKAARSAVGGGTVLEVEAGDDHGEAYEVEVRSADGTEWDVGLDADFRVLDTSADD
jgi:uncharacterized membrane protein YkoI